MHSAARHLQASEFSAEPSLIVHGARAHKLIDAVHPNPVAAEQVVEPQVQIPSFDFEPSMIVQTGTAEHKWTEEVQKKPVSAVQPIVLQRHGVMLSVIPFVYWHTGADMHMQYLALEELM